MIRGWSLGCCVLCWWVLSPAVMAVEPTDWAVFRGSGSQGVADGYVLPALWNVGAEEGQTKGVLWRTEVPGLGHSSPTICGDRLFLATAIATEGQALLEVGRGGEPTAADDNGEQSWVVLCYDKHSGKELWRHVARQGKPRATRHAKATHANTTVVTDGHHVVAFFGSEGLYCYDVEGNLLWERDLGVINISKYGIGWGYASSPAIHQDRLVIVCDDPEGPFIAALRLEDGEELWRVSRQDDCERSWGTPLVHAEAKTTQVVVNGWPWIVAYDWQDGTELWRIRGGGDNPIPTPFVSGESIYITNAHGADSPIFVIHPWARGELSIDGDEPSNGEPRPIRWSTMRGGSYMSTPVVYRDYLYLGNTNGVVRCFHARNGEKIFEKRLPDAASIIASLVAADGKIYCASENGNVYVLAAGPEFKLLGVNSMGAPCFATPAISAGVLFIRTTTHLVAISSTP